MKIKTISAILATAFLASTSSYVLVSHERPLFAAEAEKGTKNKDKAATADKNSKSSQPWRSPAFRALNADDDDKISKEEFMKPYTDQFKQKDADNDGALSADEFDFPPGTPPEMRENMRKHMQEDEIRMEQMRAEMEKQREEDMKRMQEQDKARQEAEAAARAAEEAKAAADVKGKDSAPAESKPAAKKPKK